MPNFVIIYRYSRCCFLYRFKYSLRCYYDLVRATVLGIMLNLLHRFTNDCIKWVSGLDPKYETYTQCWLNVGQRLRRLANIKPALYEVWYSCVLPHVRPPPATIINCYCCRTSLTCAKTRPTLN